VPLARQDQHVEALVGLISASANRIVLAGGLVVISPWTSISRPFRLAASSALVGTLISNGVSSPDGATGEP